VTAQILLHKGNDFTEPFSSTDLTGKITKRVGTTSFDVSVTSGLAGANGNYLFIDSNSGSGIVCAASWDPPGVVSAPFNWLLRLRRHTVENGDFYRIMWFSDAAYTTAYGFRFGGTPALVRINPSSGTLATLATQTTGLVTQTSWFWLRVSHIGSSINCRVWQDGAAEPATWQLSATDSSYASGSFLLGMSGTNSDYYVDYMALTFAGDATYHA
jgi:hypothetical protein